MFSQLRLYKAFNFEIGVISLRLLCMIANKDLNYLLIWVVSSSVNDKSLD